MIQMLNSMHEISASSAEESAASSEELSRQANMLLDMVGKFKVKTVPPENPRGGAPDSLKSPDNHKQSPSAKNRDKISISWA